ncbi:hypothetical protein [Levilactobacillus parabrevis]|uniref:hypothetical protein n=1 Tax=Levilactobacillus parabrevis TaxID=357278 RepID=UPI0021A84772|nr:hypothetical protein [Levilactobacillus parabrevis]
MGKEREADQTMRFNRKFYRSVRFWSGLVVIGLMLPNVISVRLTSVFWWVSLACLVGGVGYLVAGMLTRK